MSKEKRIAFRSCKILPRGLFTYYESVTQRRLATVTDIERKYSLCTTLILTNPPDGIWELDKKCLGIATSMYVRWCNISPFWNYLQNVGGYKTLVRNSTNILLSGYMYY